MRFMSKKLIIPLDNIRNDLPILFHRYLENLVEVEDSTNWWDDMDDDELRYYMAQGFIFPGINDLDDDDECIVFPMSKGKKKGGRQKSRSREIYDAFWDRYDIPRKSKHKKGKGKKGRIIDINTPYSGEEENPNEVYDDYVDISNDDGIYNGKEIYFYVDYNDKECRLEFETLKAFDEFCADNGYVVPPYTAENIAYRRVSHTCLRPDAKDDGIFEIMAEESYADMMYEACDVKELSQ